jgi:fibronectin type 3 domain-containing protein
VARLPPPINVSATDGTEPTVIITWDAVYGAGSYAIYRSSAKGDQGQLIGANDETTWNDTTALMSKVYWYGVIARGSGNCSVLSEQDDGYIGTTPPPVDPPDAPLSFVATFIS